MLGTEIVDQHHAEMAAVEVAGEIEEMHLEAEVAAADGGAPAEIGDGVVPVDAALLLDAGAHGIDAGGGSEVVLEPEIGGGKADRAAAFIAALDAAVDLPEAAEQHRRLARPTLRQMLADAGRGIGGAPRRRHGIEDGNAEAEPLAFRRKKRR